MDGVRNPVGDLPPEVYWRRRIVIGAALVIIVAVLAVLIFSPRGDSGDPSPSGSPSPSITPSVDVSGSPGVAPDVARACTESDVTVAATPVGAPFNSGTMPVFDVTVTMNAVSSCKLTVTPETSELYIWSGRTASPDRIFNSTDCATDATFTEREFILQPAMENQVFQVTWNRQRSAEGCGTATSTPAAGFYWAELSLQGIAAPAVQFELR